MRSDREFLAGRDRVRDRLRMTADSFGPLLRILRIGGQVL